MREQLNAFAALPKGDNVCTILEHILLPSPSDASHTEEDRIRQNDAWGVSSTIDDRLAKWPQGINVNIFIVDCWPMRLLPCAC